MNELVSLIAFILVTICFILSCSKEESFDWDSLDNSPIVEPNILLTKN